MTRGLTIPFLFTYQTTKLNKMTNFWTGFEKKAISTGAAFKGFIHGLATRAGLPKSHAKDVAETLTEAYKRKFDDIKGQARHHSYEDDKLFDLIQEMNVATKDSPNLAAKLLKEMGEQL